MLKISSSQARPDADGWLTFDGNPYELEEGDIVLDGDYAVLKKSTANHNGENATQLLLANADEYTYAARFGGVSAERGRVILMNSMSIRFDRQVDQMDFGVEPELFMELVECDHDEHEDYDQEWRGQCKDMPPNMLVGINLEGTGKPVKATCKIVDVAYANGTVLFTDGVAYQSHPNREWIGWLKQ